MVSGALRCLWLVPAFPLLGTLVCGALALLFERPLLLSGEERRRVPLYRKAVAVIAPATVGASFAAALLCVMALAARAPGERLFVQHLFPWIEAGAFRAPAALQLDPLSSVMILAVTGVGFLIHVYSVGYMSKDRAFARYFAYLNLFMFAMLVLVLADNYLFMFVGWEGVGLCSYLLIGFWYEKPSAADAGKKAFVVNRIGDFGFLLAMFLIFRTFGSLTCATVSARAPVLAGDGTLTAGLATTIALLLFLGAVGKSAQIPLFVWLPDAMEGPTPVSALIHAATMVTAGVYMVARSAALFLLAPGAMMTVAAVGAATAAFAAVIGICQTDIKRVLAYSTVSQLGYMFLACGVGAFTAGIFHLATHAFFKALLFLGAGSVIHALSGEQDLRKMGGLKGRVPVTFAAMTVGALAIAGIPPLSGFFSKDEILWRTFSFPAAGPVLWLLAAATAGITAFYMFRLIFLAFFGAPGTGPGAGEHVHEPPWTMGLPVAVLALLAAAGGFIGVPAVLGGPAGVPNFLERWLALPSADAGAHPSAPLEIGLMLLSVGIALAGIRFAQRLYRVRPEMPGEIARRWPVLYDAVRNKFFVDEFYEWAVVRRVAGLADRLWQTFDARFLDGIVNGIADIVLGAGARIRRLQTGIVGGYAFSLLAGAVLLLGYILYRRAG